MRKKYFTYSDKIFDLQKNIFYKIFDLKKQNIFPIPSNNVSELVLDRA